MMKGVKVAMAVINSVCPLSPLSVFMRGHTTLIIEKFTIRSLER